jgi:hypothetical protein
MVNTELYRCLKSRSDKVQVLDHFGDLPGVRCFLHKAMVYLVTAPPEAFASRSPCRGESFKSRRLGRAPTGVKPSDLVNAEDSG